MRITIIIHEHGQGLDLDGCRLPRSEISAPPAGSVPIEAESITEQSEDSEGKSDPPAPPTAAEIRDRLAQLGVERPDSLLQSYRPERISEVIDAAERKKDKLKNPAGYVLRALAQRWAV